MLDAPLLTGVNNNYVGIATATIEIVYGPAIVYVVNCLCFIWRFGLSNCLKCNLEDLLYHVMLQLERN